MLGSESTDITIGADWQLLMSQLSISGLPFPSTRMPYAALVMKQLVIGVAALVIHTVADQPSNGP